MTSPGQGCLEGSLSSRRSDQVRVRVEVVWDGSTRWLVHWQGGPTEEHVRALVERFVPTVAPSFVGVRLHWDRGRPSAAWARLLIAATRAGKSWEGSGWEHELASVIDGTDYPEVAVDADEGPLVARLLRLAGPGTGPASEYRMADILAAHGLGGWEWGTRPLVWPRSSVRRDGTLGHESEGTVAALVAPQVLGRRDLHTSPIATSSFAPSDSPADLAASGLPPSITPGAIDSRVAQSTIASTICRNGHSATVSPPESYTDAGPGPIGVPRRLVRCSNARLGNLTQLSKPAWISSLTAWSRSSPPNQ